jgi:aldehyde:ferredoxin oxidoreductase
VGDFFCFKSLSLGDGKSESPVYVKIDDGIIELIDSTDLASKGAAATRQILKDRLGRSFKVVSIGPAGENRVVFASILADSDSSGSGGLGAVMGAKNLKVVAVRGNKSVKVADKDKVDALRKEIHRIKTKPEDSRRILPGSYKRAMCFGCINGCIRTNYTEKSGRTGKSMCQSGLFYYVRALRYYKKSTDVPFIATRICDDFGLDTYPMEMAIKWLDRCRKSDLLTDQTTDLSLSRIGSEEFIQILAKKIAFREGIGDQLADGIKQAAASMGEDFKAMITDYIGKTDTMQVYDPRLYLTTALFWAMEPRLPIAQLHEISRPMTMWAAKALNADFMGVAPEKNYMTSEVVREIGIREIGKRFWGSEISADFSTYEGKALAALKIQNRQNFHESLILCDMSWPIISGPDIAGYVGDPFLAQKVFSAITGVEMDKEKMERFGERIFNTQRCDQIRDGHRGRKDDVLDDFHFNVGIKRDFLNESCIVPGKEGEVLSRKSMTLDCSKLEIMKDEYYSLRNWDVATGFPNRSALDGLDLKEIADDMEKQEMLAP